MRPDAETDRPSMLDPELGRRTLLTGVASVGVMVATSGTGLMAATLPKSAALPITPVPAMVRIEVPPAVLSVEQRQTMISQVTRILSDVTGAGPKGLPYLTVLVHDTTEGGLGVAGHGYTLAESCQSALKVGSSANLMVGSHWQMRVHT